MARKVKLVRPVNIGRMINAAFNDPVVRELSPEEQAANVLQRLRCAHRFPVTSRDLVDALLPEPYGRILCEEVGPIMAPQDRKLLNLVDFHQGVGKVNAPMEVDSLTYRIPGIEEHFWLCTPFTFESTGSGTVRIPEGHDILNRIEPWARQALLIENRIERAVKTVEEVGLPGSIDVKRVKKAHMPLAELEEMYAKALMLPEPVPLVSWVGGAGHG